MVVAASELTTVAVLVFVGLIIVLSTSNDCNRMGSRAASEALVFGLETLMTVTRNMRPACVSKGTRVEKMRGIQPSRTF